MGGRVIKVYGSGSRRVDSVPSDEDGVGYGLVGEGCGDLEFRFDDFSGLFELVGIEDVGSGVVCGEGKGRSVGTHIEGRVAADLLIFEGIFSVIEECLLCIVRVTSAAGSNIVYAVLKGVFEGVVVTAEVDDMFAFSHIGLEQ